MTAPRRARGILAAVLATVALASLPGAASAHATLVRTDPSDGIVLTDPPPQVRLWFTEAVLADASSFRIVDADGHAFAPSRARAADDDRTELILDLPALTKSTFRLDWRAVAADDLHVTTGTVVYGIAGSALASGGESASGPAEVVVSWLGLATIASLIGALVIGLLIQTAVRPAAPLADAVAATRARRRLQVLAAWSAATAAIAALLSLGVKAAAVGDVGGSFSSWQVVGTASGLRAFIAAGVLATVSIVLVRRTRRRLPDVIAGGAVLGGSARASVVASAVAVLAVGLAIVRVLDGHASRAGDAPWALALVGVSHVLAATIWIGGLVALVVGVLPMLRSGPDERTVALAVLRRFGWIAAICLAVTATSGLLLAGRLVATIDALAGADYGHVLLLKTGLVGLVALAALATFTALSSATHREVTERGRLGRRIRVEVAGALAIAGVAAVLSATPPAIGPAWAPGVGGGPRPAPVSGTADDLVVTLAISPSRPGTNFVTVTVHDTRRPAPARIDTVVARFDGALVRAADGSAEPVVAIPLAAIGDDRYAGGADLGEASNSMRVSVAVRRPNLPDAVFSAPWSVLPASATAPRPVVISDRPLAPVLDRAALIFVLVSVGALVVAFLRERRRGTRPTTSIVRRAWPEDVR